MEKTPDIFTTEEWFCIVTGKNVPVKTAQTYGAKICLHFDECMRKNGECKNGYINVQSLYHK